MQDEPTVQTPAQEGALISVVPGDAQDAVEESADSGVGDKPDGFLMKSAIKVVKTIDKVRRWNLESDEPDGTGRWDDAHRRRMLEYVYKRDRRRCGLCAGEMKLKGAQIEHIVPKVFAAFDVGKGGKAKPGTRYRSRLHKIDNLQAAHSYCNQRKGNTPQVSKWRHPAMPPLAVADADGGQTFELPWKPPAKSTR